MLDHPRALPLRIVHEPRIQMNRPQHGEHLRRADHNPVHQVQIQVMLKGPRTRLLGVDGGGAEKRGHCHSLFPKTRHRHPSVRVQPLFHPRRFPKRDDADQIEHSDGATEQKGEQGCFHYAESCCFWRRAWSLRHNCLKKGLRDFGIAPSP